MSDADIKCDTKEDLNEPLVERSKRTKRGTKHTRKYKGKRKVIICWIIVLTSLLLIVGLYFLNHFVGDPTVTIEIINPKTILVWDTDVVEGGLPLPPNYLDCGDWQCTATVGWRSVLNMTDVPNYDAIVFNAEDEYTPGIAGQQFIPAQYHVYVGKQMLSQNLHSSNTSNDAYNFIMTYKSDNKTLQQTNETYISNINATKFDNTSSSNKTLYALFIVNHPCKYKTYEQGLLLMDIKEYMSVDIICEPVNDLTFSIYKYFFTFEDMRCMNIFSNNYYKALVAGVVPVVLSTEVYSESTPSRAHISGTDFASTDELVDYLINLEQKLYYNYLRAGHEYLRRPTETAYCGICGFLHLYKTDNTEVCRL